VIDHVERRIGDLTIRIDRLLCVGFGDCIAAAPEAFAFDDDGIVAFLDTADRTGREELIRACQACPVDALTAFDNEGRRLAP
jgi:ferredoxin